MKIMATKIGYKTDAVRVKAMKMKGNYMPDARKFSVDPQITTFEVLRSILTKAFDIKQDFTIFYRVLDDYDQETYLPMLSDWDLDAAFLSAVEPCLCLRIEHKIYEEVREEWDSSSNSFSWIIENKIPLRLQGLIMNHVEKTVNIVRGAFNFTEDIQQAQEVISLPPRPPVTDIEFRDYLDPVGQLVRPDEFRNAIYFGGVEPSLRKVVWKHLLNVYPKGLTGKQRIDYMQRKSYDYEQLKNSWKNVRNNQQMEEELSYVTGMVKKDVLRTDRQHHFYSGNDDNQNIVSLFNILTTYSLNHPSVSYCQGMSDLASPLLVTMGNEAHAYICFCALMQRLSANFLLDGVAMTQRFQHLSDGLLFYDPTFFSYLKAHQADDLLFCYRWLLLEMKREFAFDDALRMLEVMWSSLPPSLPSDDLPLYEVRFCLDSQFLPPQSPTPRESPYTKVCALRRQTSYGKILMVNRSLDESVIAKRRLHSNLYNRSKKCSSFDDNTLLSERYNNLRSIAVSSERISQSSVSVNSSSSESDSSRASKHSSNRDEIENAPKTSSRVVKNLNEFLTLEKQHSKKKKNATVKKDSSSSSTSSPDDSTEYYPMTTSMTQKLSKDLENLEKLVFDTHLIEKNDNEEVFVWENPLPVDTEGNIASKTVDTGNRFESTLNSKANSARTIMRGNEKMLPDPMHFGGGNPFLMFLCISVLCQHRDVVMKNGMDYNEIAMHFDKMVRKHDVTRVLNHARILYTAYLKQHKQNYLKV